MGGFGIHVSDLRSYEGYLDFLFSRVDDAADELLAGRMEGAGGGFERRVGPGFARVRGYIVPSRVVVEWGGVPVGVAVATNPSLRVRGGEAVLYLRVGSLASEFSGTFVAESVVPVGGLRGVVSLRARPLLPRFVPYECVEDPRVDAVSGGLYHVRAFYLPWGSYVFTFVSPLGGGGLEVVRFVDGDGRVFLLRDYRDTFPLGEGYMVVRPYLRGRGVGGVFVAPRRGAVVEFDEMRPVPQLLPGGGEVKTGGNASVRLSSNEYVLFYHVVDRYGVYWTYAALFDGGGELLALTGEPVAGPGLAGYPGRRPGTLFVCGAWVLGEEILLTAGVGDEAAVVLTVGVDELFGRLRRVGS